MEELRLLKHLVVKTDATAACTAAEHTACSSLDTRPQTFSFRFGSQFVPLLFTKTHGRL